VVLDKFIFSTFLFCRAVHTYHSDTLISGCLSSKKWPSKPTKPRSILCTFSIQNAHTLVLLSFVKLILQRFSILL